MKKLRMEFSPYAKNILNELGEKSPSKYMKSVLTNSEYAGFKLKHAMNGTSNWTHTQVPSLEGNERKQGIYVYSDNHLDILRNSGSIKETISTLKNLTDNLIEFHEVKEWVDPKKK